jgi:tRNA (guanine-N7-)-methyltransferase
MARSRPAIDVSAALIDPELPQHLGVLDWRALFGNDHPVELEIGSGKGLFLVNASRVNPARNYLGVELSRKYAQLAAERVTRAGLPNAKVLRGDARLVLARNVPTASLRAVHIYFPDPWWKKRHKKRRVFTDALVCELERTLHPGGELRIASDVEEYSVQMRTVVALHSRFREQPVVEPSIPEHDLDYLTNFERKYRQEGRPIFRTNYLRD